MSHAYETLKAADDALVASGYMLSMLTEPRPEKERAVLLDAALSGIQRAQKILESGGDPE